MSEYDRSVEAAKRLIERKGVQCVWRKLVTTPADQQRPWLGGTDAPDDHTPFIAFVPATDTASGFGLTKFRDNGVSFSTYGLMAPQDFDPEVTDTLLRDGQPLVIAAVDTIKPADVAVLHVLSIV